MDSRDQVVVVTGASSGIGCVAVRAFAERGGVVAAVASGSATPLTMEEAHLHGTD